MAAVTGTVVKRSELAGEWKIIVLAATIGSASDTIDITAAAHGITEIGAILGAYITAGADAAFSYLQVTLTDSNTVTVVSFEQDGTAATDFTGTTVAVALLAR